MEDVIKIIFHILDPDVMRFRQYPLVGIGLFNRTIKSQTLNRCRVVKWLMVVEQPIVQCEKYTISEYILIISEHQSTNLASPSYFNMYME